MQSIPNLLSILRLIAAPVLLLVAWLGESSLFLGLLVASLASDVLDGWVARAFHVSSPLGAKLDSWGDLATYSVLPLGVGWLWPELVVAELRFVAVALVAYALPILFGLVKFRRLTSYHTWGAKASSVVMGVALLVLLTAGPAWLFHAAAVLLGAEAIEEIAITWLLPRWEADVLTCWHARQLLSESA
jgi:phosphatidylserine synthase